MMTLRDLKEKINLVKEEELDSEVRVAILDNIGGESALIGFLDKTWYCGKWIYYINGLKEGTKEEECDKYSEWDYEMEEEDD